MITRQKVAPGIFWVEIPEADLRILCGCPADAVKHLIRRGLIAPVAREGVACETGPNAILLSDTPVQKGSFANLAEFPLLQMFYRQGMLIPGHPANTGRKPLLIGLGDQVRSQSEYLRRGNYGLVSPEELEATGLSREEAREMFAVKKWFSFGTIRTTSDLVDMRPVDSDTVDLAPGCVLHRKGFNRYEFLAAGSSVEVDLTLGPGEEFEPAYLLPGRAARREQFSVIHVGEGDGWTVDRPCMGSIVCAGGLFYLVDAGPHLTKSLDALGITFAEIEGIFHTHCHDDHFSGLTALVRSDRRLKYYAVPWVRASVQKKLAALMRIGEEHLSSFFEVHDLKEGAWNRVGAMEVRPLFSAHPVETTVFFFRSGEGPARRSYAHLADLASVDVLTRLSTATSDGPAALSEARRDAFLRDIREPVDLKKIDAGGGMIHGEASDFAADASARILISHGTHAPATGGRITTAEFGDAHVLIAGEREAYFRHAAESYLAAWFPNCPPDSLHPLARCPVREIAADEVVCPAGDTEADVRLILGGIAEETDSSARAVRRIGVGAFAGGYSASDAPPHPVGARARSMVTVLSIPVSTWRRFLKDNGGPEACREPPLSHDALSLCPAFAGVTSEGVLRRIAAQAEERHLPAGTRCPAPAEPGIFVLALGELDLTVGSQLLETLGPGGFWGEERVVSSAPGLSTATAVTDCVYLVLPATALHDVPCVRWELLETFERRLRSFRAGFRFEWSESFRVNVRLLDEQHRELFSRVNVLSQALAASGDVEGHAEEKARVLEYARLHFRDEEKLMTENGYSRWDVQKRAHEMLLAQLERLAAATERRARPRTETAVDYLKEWLISHTLLEDLQYRDFFTMRGIR
ncbi:MAG TPA: bacteriohemerythrin [Spirochaetia bacterium]|nr:bacteriohemerythrin [Spirochaetia bacterium]